MPSKLSSPILPAGKLHAQVDTSGSIRQFVMYTDCRCVDLVGKQFAAARKIISTSTEFNQFSDIDALVRKPDLNMQFRVHGIKEACFE